MKQAEIAIGISVLLVMLLRLFVTFNYASVIISLLILILSMLYFGLSFGLLNQIRLRQVFKKESYKGITTLRLIATIATGFVLSIITIAILFRYQRWPYGSINLLIGLFSLTPILAVVIFKYIKYRSSFYKTLLIRLSIISFVGLLLFFTKSETLLEMKHRNHPEYVEAVKNEMKNPDNKVLQQKTNEARLKRDSTK